MRHWLGAALVAIVVTGGAHAGEIGDQLASSLYDGTISDLAASATDACEAGEGDACFALGLDSVISAFEGFSQTLYRHGAVTPDTPAAAMLLGLGVDVPSAPANPDPEPMTYELLRAALDTFVATLDTAAGHMRAAGEGSAFVVHVEPLKVRLDLNGDGERSEGETLGALLQNAGGNFELPSPDDLVPSSKSKSKGVDAAPEVVIGFDNADAVWFAGYANITAAPADYILAHDFSDLFGAYFHRFFPKSGLPMSSFTHGGTLIIDAESDAFIADMIAALHTAEFPVIDQPRLAGVLARLGAITELSRRNWELILAETDDDFELVPSPSQTSFLPDQAVTEDIVDAWLATLDRVDEILAGELLLPHWRFTKGFNLKTYFETATETDFVMLFTGQDALPFLADGPVADAQSFADLNRTMGDEWPLFALWFN